MKASIHGLALTALVATNASALELTEYRNPNTSFNAAYLDFSANANSGNQDQVSYNTLLNLSYTFRDGQEHQVWGFNGNGLYNNSRGPNAEDSAEVNYGLDASVFTDRYLVNTNPNLFYFAALDYASDNNAVDDSFGLAAGVGYGRVWNATPLAQALRFIEELEAIGLLRTEATDTTLRRIANLIAKEDEYVVEHGAETYKGVWYEDIESALTSSGTIAGMTALATIKLDDVLFNEPISARRHGWLVRLGAGFQSNDLSGLVDNDPKLTFQGEYAMPVGLKGQWIDTFTYEPIFGDNTVQSLHNTLSYTYEVSDKIDWINALDSTWQVSDDSSDTRFTRHTLSSGFNFHLTNQMDLGVSLAIVDTDETPNLDTSNDEVEATANLSMRYRLK